MNKVKLGELCDAIVDCPHSTPHWEDSGVLAIRNYNLEDTVLAPRNPSFVSEETFRERTRRATPEAGDIIISREAPIGRVGIVPEGMKCCLGQRLVLLKPDRKKINPRYLLAALTSDFVRVQYERADALGSIVSNLSLPQLTDLEIPVVDNADEVAALIAALDDKIALNKKMMAELEKTARLIYDYWFMQFDFPDEDGRPYRSSGGKMVYSEALKRNIPAGWEVASVSELAHVEKGVSYKADDLKGPGVPMINLASFNTDGTYKSEGLKTFSGNIDLRKTASPFDLVMCITQQTAIDLSGRTNVVGKAFFVPDVFGETAVISTDVCKFEVREDTHAYLLNGFFKRPEVHKHIVGFANGTKIKHLDTVGAFEMRLPIPPTGSDVLKGYREKAGQLEELKSNLLKENLQLSSLRDWLLPMLMNGQVTVGD